MVYNIYFYGSERDAVVVTDMDGKQLVIDCKKAETQVIFDEPQDAGILARFAREEPAGYVSMAMRPGGLQDYVDVWNELNQNNDRSVGWRNLVGIFLWEDYWTGGFDIMKMQECRCCVFANCKLQFLIEKHDKKCYNIQQYKCQIVHRNWRIKMAVNYDKLWDILNERGMMKTELIREAKISTNAMAKLGRNEDVRVVVLEKICLALDCKMDDILDIVPDKEQCWREGYI